MTTKLPRLFIVAMILGAPRLAITEPATSPQIQALLIDGKPTDRVAAGQWVTLVGSGFGSGVDIDFAKVMVGTSRALERDLRMYTGSVKLLKQLFFEKTSIFDEWPSDLRHWDDGRIEFRIPAAASFGPIVVQVQKRLGANPAFEDPSRAHVVWDPLTERIDAKFPHASGVVAQLGAPEVSNPWPVIVSNPEFSAMVERGEAVYWSWDYNMGLVHKMRGLDWSTILRGTAVDPVTGKPSDPAALFGAVPTRPGEVPAVALRRHYFDPYPAPMPLKPLLRKPLTSGWTTPTGYAGYVYAESIHVVTQKKGNWIGFNCASCHAQRITYEAEPGKTVTKLFPGLPNPEWTMKWNVLGDMTGVKGREPGPDGVSAEVDKTLLLYAIPPGTGEPTIVRTAGDGSHFANDHLFSPVAIPIITRHTPIRRALSHTEMVAGFEGSYVHAEEPDGAIGAMRSGALKDLTAYMTTLDRDDAVLEKVGIYRWLQRNGMLVDVDEVGEGDFVQKGKAAFPRLQSRLERGEAVFNRDCKSCHQPNFGTFSDENMFTFAEVGTYFSPTLFQLKAQSIRTSILRNLFWVEKRGLLHDGHVKSHEDLVNPDRCQPGTELYRKYYTVHPQSFRIAKGNAAQERALRGQAYFTDVSWDRDHLYWDYQKMRTSFGPRELGTTKTVALPAAPHPWCARNAEDVSDLVLFLMTL